MWLEGGPRLAGAFWNAGLIDRVIGYIAPAMLGSGRAALEGEATTLADLRRIEIDDLRRIGPDIRIIGTPHPSGRPGPTPRTHLAAQGPAPCPQTTEPEEAS